MVADFCSDSLSLFIEGGNDANIWDANVACFNDLHKNFDNDFDFLRILELIRQSGRLFGAFNEDHARFNRRIRPRESSQFRLELLRVAIFEMAIVEVARLEGDLRFSNAILRFEEVRLEPLRDEFLE